MIELANRFQDLEESPIVLFSSLALQCQDVIRLNSGSPGHGVIPQVQDAEKQVSLVDMSTYRTHPFGSIKVRESVKEYYLKRYGMPFDPVTEINVTTGFTHLFKCVCETILNPGDIAAITDPVFPQYIQPILLTGAKLCTIPTKEEDRWKLKPEAIAEVLQQDIKMLVLNYPNNPTGAYLDWQEWHEIIDVLLQDIDRRERENKAFPLIVLDDAYVPLIHQGSITQHITYGKVLWEKIHTANSKTEIELLNKLMDSSIICCSLSKEGMAGVLAGMGASKNQELMAAIRIAGKSSVISVSSFGETAINSLVNASEDTLMLAGQLYERRLKQLADGLNSIFHQHKLISSDNFNTKQLVPKKPISYIPQAGMYLFVNLSQLLGTYIQDDEVNKIKALCQNKFQKRELFKNNKLNSNFDIALWLLYDARVAVVPMGNEKQGYLRFSVGLPQAVIETKKGLLDFDKTQKYGEKILAEALERINFSIKSLIDLNQSLLQQILNFN